MSIPHNLVLISKQNQKIVKINTNNTTTVNKEKSDKIEIYNKLLPAKRSKVQRIT